MSNKQSENKNKDSMALLGLLLFLGAGYLLFNADKIEKTNDDRSKVYSKDFESNVNKHLMITSETIEQKKAKAQLENNKYILESEKYRAQNPYQNQYSGVDMSADTSAEDVARELGRAERPQDLPQTPHELVQAELFSDAQDREYTKAYKDEYARKFIENAERSGWKVKLSEDYHVISVTPIRTPSSKSQLFRGGSAQ